MNEVMLGSLLELITKGTTPPRGKGFVEKGINYIKSDAINYDCRIDKSKFVAINPETHKKFKRSQLKEDDILFSMAGAYLGKNGIVTKEMLPANTNQALAILRVNKEKALPYYISQFLRQPLIIDFINNMSGQSAQPNINFQEISNIEIPLPPLPEQKAIAEILSSIDDKIDLLHRQNETLEQMAQTLFRQWFVEEVDEDWEEGFISDLAKHHKKSIRPQQNLDTIYHHYSIPSFDNNKTPVVEMGAEIKSNKYEIPENCIMFSKLNPHKDKRLWLIQSHKKSNSIASTEFQIVLPKKEKFLFFIYGWLNENMNYREIASGVGGTSSSHQRISPSIIFDFPCPIITDLIIEKYNEKVQPAFEKIDNNQQQLKTLEKLRDTLLPKLMNGEVKVNL